nr:HNH endonuclease [uncultured Methanolobus sp.]
MNKAEYKKSINKQKRDKETVLCCSICGESSPETLENHHLYGRKRSPKTRPLCKNCHAKITAEQNKLSPKARKDSQQSFALVSIGAILKEIGDELLILGFEVGADE